MTFDATKRACMDSLQLFTNEINVLDANVSLLLLRLSAKDATKNAAVHYVEIAVLSNVILNVFSKLLRDGGGRGGKGGKGGTAQDDKTFSVVLVRTLSQMLSNRYAFATKGEDALRAQVREQMEKENQERRKLRESVPEEQQEYLKNLQNFKRIETKDIYALLEQKGDEEEKFVALEITF